jgi:hypothetical protein
LFSCQQWRGRGGRRSRPRAEQDLEELRRIALAQHAQIRHLIRRLEQKCSLLSFYNGNKDELQENLALIEGLTQQAKAAEGAAKAPTPAKKDRTPRKRAVPTEQLDLPHVPQLFSTTLTAPAPAAAATCNRWQGSTRPRR